MAIGTPLPPDYNHPQASISSEVRTAESLGVQKGLEIDPKNPVFILRKKVSGSVGEIIHVAEKRTVKKITKEQTQSLKVEQEKHEKYLKMHTDLDQEVAYENIDDILKKPRRMFLESHIFSLYKGKFDKDGNIIIGGIKVIRKGAPEYKEMIEKGLHDLKIVMHALIRDAEKRGVDPDTL